MSPSLEIAVRVGWLAAVFAAMALWEWFAPRRHLTAGRRPRWPGNLGILAIDIIAVRLLVPTAAVGVALIAAERGWGLFQSAGLAGLGGDPARRDRARSRDLHPARRLPSRAGAVAAAPHASRRSRYRRDHRRALPSVGDFAVAGDQDGGGGGARRAGARGADLRGAAQRHLDVQPQQCGAAAAARADRALDRGDAADASGASLDRARGNRQQFRI